MLHVCHEALFGDLVYKSSIDKETNIVGVGQGRVDDVISINLQNAPCLQPENNTFEDRIGT